MSFFVELSWNPEKLVVLELFEFFSCAEVEWNDIVCVDVPEAVELVSYEFGVGVGLEALDVEFSCELETE